MHIINRLLAPLNLRISRVVAPSSSTDRIATYRDPKEKYNDVWRDARFMGQYRQGHQAFYDDLLLRMLKEGVLQPATNVIDVGCGPGFFLETLAQRGLGTVLSGCDFSENAVQAAVRNCPEATFFVHDIYEPLDRQYDLLFCTETLEHLLYPARALRQLLAASRVAVVTVPDGRNDSYIGHINFWSPESWGVFCQEGANGRLVKTDVINGGRNLLTVFR